MLTTDIHIYLVEMKDQSAGGWRPQAIQQLISTIRMLTQNHDLSRFRHKKAFACNKKRPRFDVIDHEQNKRFFREFGFRLDSQATVVLVEPT